MRGVGEALRLSRIGFRVTINEQLPTVHINHPILGDPTRGDRQGDVLTYGLSFARAVRQGVEVVGEVNGRYSARAEDTPPGAESRAALRVGGRITRGTVRVDGGLIIGMTSRDPGFGVTAGLTWVFRAFTVP